MLAGPRTDAYQEETPSGLVLASEVEKPRSCAATLVGSDLEKGALPAEDAKIVTFLQADPGESESLVLEYESMIGS